MCLLFEGTKYKAHYRLTVMKVKKFVDFWNKELEQRKRQRNQDVHAQATKFAQPYQQLPEEKKGEDEASDNRIYIGNLPVTMPETEARRLCASFGTLKNFNLLRDPLKPDQSKGFAFFEYVEEKAADKAIRALNDLDFKDKKLKV